MPSIMPPIKDHERLALKLAQFKLLSTDEEFANNKDIEFVLQELNLNATVPDVGFLKERDNEQIIGHSLLHLAYENGNIDLYNVLISKGADFNGKDKEGNTVLHKNFYQCWSYHVFKKYTEFITSKMGFIVPTLSAHVEYRNINNPSNSNGLTHFHIACASDNMEACEFFLNNGVLIDQAAGCEYFRGYTPLHFAAEFGCIQVTEMLLKRGANTNLESSEGKTPIHIALEKNIAIIDSGFSSDAEIHEKIINLLLNHSISLKIPHLFVASAMKNSYMAADFLAKGMNVKQSISMDSKIWPGYTALHFAARVNVDTVKLLIRYGANIEAKDAKGVTAINLCMRRYKIEDIIEIINLVPTWKDILLSDGKTKLVDLLCSFKSSDDISNFLEKCKENVKLFVPFDSPLWPGFTVLHIAVLLTERKKCEADYKIKENSTIKVYDPDLSIITTCLKLDTDVTMKNHRNRTPVHLAFQQGKKKTLNLLLQYHHKIENSTDGHNLSHLHIACARNNEDLVKKLLWNGADVNIVYQSNKPIRPVYRGWTPLHVAVYKQNNEIAKQLLQFGADIFIPDRYGFTAVHRLISLTNRRKLGETVFSVPNLRDYIVEGMGLSYLHVACAIKDIDAAKRLLDLGADVNRVIVCPKTYIAKYPRIFDYKRYDGCTPLHLALIDYDPNRAELVSLLIDRGADLFAEKKNDMTPLCEVLDAGLFSFLEVVTHVLKRNADLQRRLETETGITMLHVASWNVDVDMVKELLESGVDVNAQVHENSKIWSKFTPLHLLLHGDEDSSGGDENLNSIMKMLIKRKADVTLMNGKKDTPLHVIYRKICIEKDTAGYDNVILLLKAHKNFEVNPTNVEGISHFHIACHMLEIDVVENFLEHNVDVNSKIDAFCNTKIAAKTALHLAIVSARDLDLIDTTENPFLEFARLRIVDLLIEHGADVNVEDVFGNTPAHYSASCRSSKENIFQRLANSRANVNATNIQGEASLGILLKQANLTINEVRFFVAFGCRFNAFNTVTGRGYVALTCASNANSNMVLLLFGAFVNSPNSMKVDERKRTIVHNIVSINDLEISLAQYIDLFDLFMKYGCDIDDQDDLGRTALHLAVQFRNERAIEGLLAAGADINIEDRDGKTPFIYVFERCSRCITNDDTNHNPYSHRWLFETFIRQIKKMELCDIFVNPLNGVLLNTAMERFDIDSFADDLNGFLVEINQMSSIKIESYSLSAADFLSAAVGVIDYPMMSLDKRMAINKFFQTRKRQFQTKFKQIAGILQLQYRQALLRRKIIDTAIDSLRVLARCRLPDICSHIILRSLKNFELQNLIASTAENGVTNAMDVDR